MLDAVVDAIRTLRQAATELRPAHPTDPLHNAAIALTRAAQMLPRQATQGDTTPTPGGGATVGAGGLFGAPHSEYTTGTGGPDYSYPATGGGGGAGAGVPGGATPVSYSSSGGVEQWRPNVEEALRRNNMPVTPDNVNKVLYQIQTESSGDPNAINNWDTNAAAGTPSQGLLQTVPGTFQQYHLPGDSANILDPQANLDAALNYHKETYGPDLAAPGGQGIGSGHGY